MEKVMKNWKRLPRGVVEPPSLEAFKRSADAVPGTLGLSGRLGSARVMIGLNDL